MNFTFKTEWKSPGDNPWKITGMYIKKCYTPEEMGNEYDKLSWLCYDTVTMPHYEPCIITYYGN